MVLPQVNGISLIGETHKEVVRILKELPVCVFMTCCRPAPHTQANAEPAQPQPEAPLPKVKLLIIDIFETYLETGQLRCVSGKGGGQEASDSPKYFASFHLQPVT